MAGFEGFKVQADRDRNVVRLALGNPDEKMAVELAPNDAAEIGKRLTEAAGYLLIEEVPPGATYDE
jgi:hypothetical protein